MMAVVCSTSRSTVFIRCSGTYQPETAFYMKADKKYCFWSNGNCTAEKYLCCHSCKVKNCDFRCLDDYDSCDYKVEINPALEEHVEYSKPEIKAEKPIDTRETVSENLCKQLQELRSIHKWTIAYIAKISEVQGYIIQRCLAGDSVRVSKDQYDKLVNFINKNQEENNRDDN